MTFQRVFSAGLGVSPGGFRAECRTVLGKTQAPRMEASQGNYYPGFIQPNKQKNKQTNKHVCVRVCIRVYVVELAGSSHLPTTVLKAGPSWVKLDRHEWKRPRGFTVRVLFNQTNKQTNKQDRLG